VLTACENSIDILPTQSEPIVTEPITNSPGDTLPNETEVEVYTITKTGEFTDFSLSKIEAEAGQTITITISFAQGKEIDTIIVKKGNEDILVTNNTFVMPNGSVTVEVLLKDQLVPLYTITLPNILGVDIEIMNQETSFAAGDEIDLDITLGNLYRLKAGSLKYVFGPSEFVIIDNKFIMPAGNVSIIIEVEQIILPLVTDIIIAVIHKPDPWVFLPESFAIENKVFTSTQSYDYSNFVSVSSITNQGIGKQMNVLYDIMLDVENALNILTPVYQVSNQVASLYQNYINENPEDYSHFETTIAGITFIIDIETEGYSLSIIYGEIQINLYYDDLETGYKYGGHIRLSEANVIKYEVSENHLIIAARLLGTFRAHIEFLRDDQGVRGSLYHFVGVNEIGLSTRALLHVGSQHTTIIGEKGDFLVTATVKRNVEVYSNLTGKMVGAEVKESVPLVGEYDTMWYPIQNISGITNVKATNVSNGNNPNTIYINNSSTVFNPHTVFIVGTRYYDIELKTQYFYTYDLATNTYAKIEMLIPMFFIQRSYEDSTGYSPMSTRFGVTMSNSATIQEKNAINYGYDTLLPIYDTIRENMTPQYVIDYVSTIR
jgi:hypothetical protein